MRVVALAGLSAVVLGAAIAHGSTILLAVVVGGPLVVSLAALYPGVTVGVVWLAALNGIPLVNIATGGGEFRPTDLAVAAIVLMAVARCLADRRSRPLPPRGVTLVCALFAAWWAITFVRTLYAGVPPVDALFFGRDFLSMAVLIPAAWILLDSRRAWRECLIVVVVGTGIYSLAYVGGALGLIDAASFVHPQQIVSFGGVLRLYTPMNDLVVTVAVFSIAFLATTRRGRATPWIAVVAALTSLAFLLQLTRAAYLSVALGIVIAVVVASTRGADVRRVLIQRLTVVLLAGGIFFFAATGLGSTSIPSQIVGERISAGVGEIAVTSGTFGYRVRVYKQMFAVLGSDWPIGLGFLNPKDRYFLSLPGGTIRDGDVGLMNAVMTMGVIGLALLFALPVSVARWVAKTPDGRPTWMMVGLFGWLVVLVAGSPTLVTLFSATGILSTALALSLCGVARSARIQDRELEV